jgi:hypothetical protein
MNDKIVLLCCTGRSGSTTLQRIINTIPNSNICGENYGAINSLLLFYKKLKQTTFIQVPGKKIPIPYEVLIEKSIKPAWYNSYNLNEMQYIIKEQIIRMFKNSETTTIWGFKEIRYENKNIELLKEFKELFPNVKIIIQIRQDTQKQSQSSWFKKDPNSKAFLEKQNKNFKEFYEKNKDYCFFNTFENMFDMENMRNMFEFIGCKNEFNEEKIKGVLENELKNI